MDGASFPSSAIESGDWLFECDRKSSDFCEDRGKYGGAPAYWNRFETTSDDMTIIDFDTAVFRDNGIATIDDRDVNVTANSLKFGLEVSGATYTDTLEICIEDWVSTWYYNQRDYAAVAASQEDDDSDYYNDDQDVLVWSDPDDTTTRFNASEDGRIVQIGEYIIYNDLTAKCLGYDDIEVSISTEFVGVLVYDYEGFYIEDESIEVDQPFAKVKMCYTFEPCQSGDIVYDPFVYYEGEDADSSFKLISMDYILSGIITAFFILYH